MDRRSNAKTTDSSSGEQLKKALGVIIQSYKGIPPEQLYREAICCFDALTELSYKNEAAGDFASSNGIHPKYLADGANFILSKMHFNPENDYYIALGLSQNASQDEIRERWKKLMLLYHPDRQIGNEDWFIERAKKINEAYNTLKDNYKRMDYTRNLRKQMLYAKSIPPSHVRTRPLHQKHSWKHTIFSALSALNKYLPSITVSLIIFFTLIFIGFIYFQNPSPNLESELFLEKQQALRKTDLFSEKKQELSVPPNIEPESKKDNVSNAKEQKIALPDVAIIDKRLKQKANEPKEQTTKKPDVQKDVKQPSSLSSLLSSNTAAYFANKDEVKIIAPVQSEAGQKQAMPNTASSPSEHRTEEQHYQPVINKNQQEAKTMTASTFYTNEPTKEDVDTFLQRYIKAYENNDLETFMSFFSKSAVENNRLDYTAIQNSYKNTFSEKINSYSLQDIVIRIDGLNVFVSGTYNINRYLSAKDRWVRYNGKVYWKLTKENNSLKIIGLDYDN